jgi:vacuolar-type H+-ATPase subunit H
MSVERVLSIGKRLQRLLDEAETHADEIVTEAQSKAEEMVSKAKAESERRRNMAQRGSGIDELIREAEEEAKVEAKNSLEDYKKKAKALKKLPKDKIQGALELVLKEVLPE